ncbi:MAG: aspartate aminotransferase family protein [Hyphomicrobiaceae bacterium]
MTARETRRAKSAPQLRDLTRSRAHFAKAQGRLPLGVASNFRYWGDDKTIYVDRGKGARIWDIDGNDYIDYRLGYGPAILGYADERVDEAAREGMARGGVFALATEKEYEVANRIARMVKGAERVRFSVSGTEAVMAALRTARGFTGRDGYVLVEGGYHGLFDAAMWFSDMDNWPGHGTPEVVPYGEGIPRAVRQLLFQVPMNDADRLEDTLRKHGDKIAAVLIEPIQGNCCAVTANDSYMKAVRELTERYGVLLIVDEVKTGFRVAKGGVQELYGITADLMTFAKAMANGYPISALAGRADIMERIGKGVAHGGTYTAHSVSIAAAAKTLEILDETDALATIDQAGRTLRDGISTILRRHRIAHAFSGTPALSGLFFASTPPKTYRDWKRSDYSFYDALAARLIERGVLVEPDSREPWFLSEAHAKDGSVAETLDRFEAALGDVLAAGSVEAAE